MRILVTGAAGFIGSHLCEALLRAGNAVLGIDCFNPYYPRIRKEANLQAARQFAQFRFQEVDLRADSLRSELEGVDCIYHLAAMPGLVRSWSHFDDYLSCNVVATQRLLEATMAAAPKLARFIYASTSSVYGEFSSGDESMPTRPISPYGVTKLAGEHLCRAWMENFGLPLVVLRYFSVYGPRQRPDMGYFQFIDHLLHDRPIGVTGDGQQARGNTFVDDCVQATLAAANAPVGETYNVGGGELATVWEIISRLENLIGRKARIENKPGRPGDQRLTFADTRKLRRHLNWQPKTSLEDGLSQQIAWQRTLLPGQ